ncbi:hypothetical protein FACS1894186_8600 [Alphaproteobacteria bacterium]|nr:hypothetical protein FACS1894186_8600 [Alphaproteobacteria bacterium]
MSSRSGTTVLRNCNVEPEISALAELLSAMGAAVEGIGTPTLTVHGQGRGSLRGADFTVIPDRIETGTYILAAGITGGCPIHPGGTI